MRHFEKLIQSYLTDNYYIADDSIRLKNCGLIVRFNGIFKEVQLIFSIDYSLFCSILKNWILKQDNSFDVESKIPEMLNENSLDFSHYSNLNNLESMFSEILNDNLILTNNKVTYIKAQENNPQYFNTIHQLYDFFLRYYAFIYKKRNLSDNFQFNIIKRRIYFIC